MTKKAEQQQPKDEVVIDGEVVAEEEELKDGAIEDEETVTDELEADEETDEETDAEPGEEEEVSDDDADEVVVTIGDEAPPQEQDDEQAKAPEWVRELRKTHRETVRENRELKARLEAAQAPATKKVEVGEKPKLENFDYDTEEYEKELAAWYERKRQADELSKQQEQEVEEAQKAWQERLNAYGEAKTKLKVKDYDEAEAVVFDMFDQTQQGIVVQGAENPALVFYALGKNEDRAKELASITDPVKFTFAVAKLEKDLKVKNRKAPPPPEKKVKSGTAPKSGAVDSTLERLRAEAEKTGNYSKVHRYKQQRRKATS